MIPSSIYFTYFIFRDDVAKIFDYLKATKKPGKDGADALFKEINKGVQPYAKQLKQMFALNFDKIFY